MAKDSNIVSFRASAPSARLKTLDYDDKRRACRHVHVEVWRREPILECTDCGGVVDPYQWIRDRCGDWDQVEARRKWQAEELKAGIADLQKELRRLRGEYADEKERRAAERAIAVLPPRRTSL